MKITKIESQKTKRGRVNLYIDGEFFSGLSEGVIVKCGLYEGKALSNTDLSGILAEEEYSLCLNRVYNLLSRRLQSRAEVFRKMRGKFTRTAVSRVVGHLEGLGYIDDRVFANCWVEARRSSSGPRKLKAELVQKGIEKEIIEDALRLGGDNSQAESAINLARKKYKPEMTDDEIWSKIGGYLSRRGFEYDTVRAVVSEIKKSRQS